MSSVLRSLMVRVGADISDFDKSMKKLSKDLGKAGKELSTAGASLTKGLTLPIVGAVAGLTGLAISAGKGADELITLSNKTGISTQALQELEYAARFVDVEVETMTGSMQKLTKNMDMARRGSKEQEEAFARLGIEIKNQDGSLRNAKDVWAEAIDALGNIASEADRDALAMNIFGKSAAELNPLIKAGSEELARLSQEARDVGAVMSDENVTALGKFDDSMQKLQAVLKTAGAEIGAAFIPVLEKLMPIIQDEIVPAIQSFAGFISGLIDKFDNASPGMQGFILAAIGIAAAIGPMLSVVGSISTGLGVLIPIISAIIAPLIAVTTAAWGFAASLLANPITWIVLAVVALAAGVYLLIKNWGPVSEFFKNLWESVANWFVTAWNNIGKFMSNTWENIKNGVSIGVKSIRDAIVNGITAAIDWIKALPGQALQWGKDMIDGFVEGIKQKAMVVVNAIRNIAEKIKNFLHFSTPDEGPLAEYKSWMPDFMKGLADGIKNSKHLVENAIADLSSGMNLSGNVSLLAEGKNGLQSSGMESKLAGTHIGNVYVTIDAKNVKDFTSVVDVFTRLPQLAKAGG